MKKIIALGLCVMLLLSGCAAVGDAAGIHYGLGDLYANGTEVSLVDMTGLNGALEAAADGDVLGLRLLLEAEGREPMQAIASVSGEQVTLALDGLAGRKVFVLEDADFAQGLTETVSGMLPGAGAAEEDVELSEEDLAAMQAQLEETLGSMSEEDLAQMQAQAELMAACFTAGEPEVIDGVEYAVTNIDIPYETLCQMLESESSGAGDILTAVGANGLRVDLTGKLGYSAEGGMFLRLDAAVAMASGDGVLLRLDVDVTDPADASAALTVEQNGEEVFSLGADWSVAAVEDASWLRIDTADAPVITDANAEENVRPLIEALADFVGQAYGYAMGVVLGNGVVASLAGK